MSWLNFVEAAPSPSGKTRRWHVRAKQGGAFLGVIEWFARWRKYVFQPVGVAVFEEVCLRDIAKFIEEKTREHRAAKKL